MKFYKYNSIENHYNQSNLSRIEALGLFNKEVIWTIREKIHGANFSFWYDGNQLKCAKRSGFIGVGENFFGWDLLYNRYKGAIEAIYGDLVSKNEIEIGQIMTIFGEIAGTMPSGKKVQKEVEYGELDFYMFDICIDGQYMDDLTVFGIGKAYKITQAPLLDVGSFKSLCNTINNFDSLYLLGKPENTSLSFPILKEGDSNITEGYVLKPVNPEFMPNDARVIIKCKSEEFQERKSRASVDRMTKAIVELSDSDVEIVNEASRYIVEPRLRNVLSKRGPVSSHKEFGSILHEFMTDVLEDFKKDGTDIMDSADYYQVSKTIKNNCALLIRKNLSDILDGKF